MSFGERYFGLERARDATTLAAAAFLKLTVVLVAALYLLYPLTPAGHFRAQEVWGDDLYVLRGYKVVVPLNLLWGLEGFRRVSEAGRGLVAGLLLGLALVPRPYAVPKAPRARSKVNKWVLFAGVAALAPVVCYLLRVDYDKNAAFGDGTWLPICVGVDDVAAAEVLSSHVFIFMRRLCDLFRAGPNGVAAVSGTSCLAGGVFAAAAFLFAEAVGEDRAEKVILFLGAVGGGYAVMFLGYVETTQLVLAMIALFFAGAALALRAGTAGRKLGCTALAIAAASLAFLAHGAGLLLVPAFAYFIARARVGVDEGRGRRWYRAFPALVAALFLSLVVVPYYLLIAKPFYLAGDFGNLRGGGDDIMFVPWTIVYGLPKSPYVYYTMLSKAHLGEIASAYLIAAPLSVPFILAGIAFRRRRRFNAGERRLLRMLGLAAAACLAVPLAWNHDFAIWGDWNIAASFLFPLNLFAWSWLILATRGLFADPPARLYFVAPLVAAQLVMAFGILFQFY